MSRTAWPMIVALYFSQSVALPTAPAEPQGLGAPRPPVELLHAIPGVVVAVSSAVNNSTDRPEHLVDGNMETAWNSRSGDLVGAWIGFRLPRTAQVASIKLTAGFTRRLGADDLFVLNHRIRRVRVTRDGSVLGELTLDPELRTLQAFAINRPGGDFKIEVLQTVPGTRARWRELCVSELQVVGQPPPGIALTRAAPRLVVGSLDGAPIAPYRTLKDFCGDYLARASLDYRPGSEEPGNAKPTCSTHEVKS